MNISDLLDNWEDISQERKKKALKALFDFLSENQDANDGILQDIFVSVVDYEVEDFFGTEGLSI